MKIFIILILMGIYFLPTTIGLYKKSKEINDIIIFNFFLGFLIVGWILAFIIALQSKDRRHEYI